MSDRVERISRGSRRNLPGERRYIYQRRPYSTSTGKQISSLIKAIKRARGLARTTVYARMLMCVSMHEWAARCARRYVVVVVVFLYVYVCVFARLFRFLCIM